jgi:guanylate kinase
MRNDSGLLVVFSGPSGVGKDSLLQRLLEVNPQIRLSVSATTRSPRGEEQHGKDYFFLSKEEFQEMIDQDGMLEYAVYCENYYGTPRQPVEDGMRQGQDVILEIEVQGGAQVRQQNPASVSIFVLPPSMKVLSQRLHKRGTDSEEVIQKRLAKAREEIQKADQYDYIVMNDDLEECVREICEILSAEKKKASRSGNLIKEVLDNE